MNDPKFPHCPRCHIPQSVKERDQVLWCRMKCPWTQVRQPTPEILAKLEER